MSIFNILFPSRCVVCREFTDSEKVFCPICASKYEQMKRKLCSVCGKPHTECRCRATALRETAFPVSQRHLFAFDGDVARTVIYKLKRKNLTGLQRFLAEELSRLIREEKRRGEAYIILYPPRSAKGVMTYGFDQAKILAYEAGRILGMPVFDAFIRENSVEQKTLSSGERAKNAFCSYVIKEKTDLSGLAVIIIDDVVTSGSTASRLCSLAFSAGAKRAVVVSVAKGVFC